MRPLGRLGVLLTCLVPAPAGGSSAKAARGLSRFTYAELQSLAPITRARLRQTVRGEGAVLLTNIPGYDSMAAEALDGFGDCSSLVGQLVVSPALLRSGVERRTLATTTHAGATKPLPDWAVSACPELARSVERLRSFVGLLLALFARSVDTAASNAKTGVHHTGLEDLVRQGTHLEHFHRYALTSSEEPALHPFTLHTDAGLLQALVVRWRAAKHAHMGLELELPSGLRLEAEKEVASGLSEGAGGLLLLLGQAAQDWLPHLRLRAAPHALAARRRSSVSSEAMRMVYGVMALPPEDFLLADRSNATFGEWWRRARQAVAWGPSKAEATDGEGCFSTGALERHLQDQADTCPAGSIYCWMQCQTVSEDLGCEPDQAVCLSASKEVCPIDGTHDATCTPACATTAGFTLEVAGAGESTINGPYRSNGWSGGKRSYGMGSVHIAWDDHWASEHYGQWVIFADALPLYYSDEDVELPPTSGWREDKGRSPAPTLEFMGPSSATQEDFCNGVLTDMHMLGFKWNSKDIPCLILLFGGWELTDATKFWVAVVGTVLAGFFTEYLVAVRRWESDRPLFQRVSNLKARKYLQKGARMALYAVTRCMGYLVMLVTMTYSVELFAAVVIGLTLGYGYFNCAVQPGDELTPCCHGRVAESKESNVKDGAPVGKAASDPPSQGEKPKPCCHEGGTEGKAEKAPPQDRAGQKKVPCCHVDDVANNADPESLADSPGQDTSTRKLGSSPL